MIARPRLLAPVVLVVAVAILYLPRLGDAPIYLMPDEVIVANTAHSLASTGRDQVHQRLLPLYFEIDRLIVEHHGGRDTRVSWLPPAIFYSAALALRVLPFSEATVRLPTAIVAIVDVLLLFLIGRRLFRQEWLAVLAAVFLALTPAHFIHSRMAADYLFPLPFMLGWLLCLLTYVDEPSRDERLLFAGTLCLGVGLYSYAASTIVMPIYFAITGIILVMTRRPARSYAFAAGGFLIPALLVVPWLFQHPTMIDEVLRKYDLNGPGNMTALQSARSMFTYHRIGDQIGLYWAFFNPRFLFFDGPMEPMFSTRQVGVFLLPLAALLGAGLYALVRQKVTPAAVLVCLGFLTAPLAATIVNIPDAIYRALEMLPFVALLAAYGVRELWNARWGKPHRGAMLATGSVILVLGALYGLRIGLTEGRMPGGASPMMILGGLIIALGRFAHRLRFGQIATLGLLALVPMQFAPFYLDYFTGYRERSSITFSGNIRGAYEEVLRESARSLPPKIYLGEIGSYSYGGRYWEFYLTKFGRRDLLDRTIDGYLFLPDHVLELPAHSLVVTNAGDGAADAIIAGLIAAGDLKRNAIIAEPDGTQTYQILERTTPR
jgi:4-amino-4-deoxy-L-arabinose transferase-like glycosyltransferase